MLQQTSVEGLGNSNHLINLLLEVFVIEKQLSYDEALIVLEYISRRIIIKTISFFK